MCFSRMMLLQVIIMTWVFGVILTSEMAASVAVLAAAPIAKPNCPDRCGDVKIPYPFGTRKGCYLDENYFVNCTNDSSGKILQPMYRNVVLLNISLDGHFEFSGYPVYECYNESGTLTQDALYRANFPDSFSQSNNVFVAVGCDTIAYINGTRNNRNFSMGCMSICQDTNGVVDRSCSGIGCCKVKIPKGLRNFTYEARSFNRHQGVWKFNPCSYAFIVKKDAFSFSTEYLHGLDLVKRMFPAVINWGIRDEKCAESNIPCGGNSTCYDRDTWCGYRCRCNHGYSGNPYLPNGCLDINECQSGNNCTHPERCKNTMGNYTCSCTKWYRGDGREDGTGCDVNLPLLIKMVVELLTGEKAVSLLRAESERNLAAYFISALINDRLLEIIEGHIIKEGNVEEVKEVSYIAKRCLRIKGEDRPTMKVVAMELEGLRIMKKHSHGKADLYKEEAECSHNAITSYLSLDDGTANSSTSTTIDSMGHQVSKSTIVCR